jgi:tetratricopeptide (TPR) repeat protein
MTRAIAGWRRACQAAVLAAVLSLTATASPGGKFAAIMQPGETRSRQGAPVKVSCFSDAGGATTEIGCGALPARAEGVIAKLSALLGPFPHPSLRLDFVRVHARGPRGYYSAVPGKITQGLDFLRFSESDLFLPDLLPREIARQWLLSAGWQAGGRDEWLAEGLPEYLAWRYLGEAHPEVARALVTQAMRDYVAGGLHQPLFGSAEETEEEGEALILSSRQRGLLVLRTLETVIDRERVDRVLPVLIRRSGKNPPSVALLEKVCEEIAGRNLRWFFDYFVEGTGMPTIELRRLPSETPGIAAGEILVKGLPPEGSVRVEMAVHTAQGVIAHSVATRGEVTPFTVNVPAPALGITLDPDQRILRWTEAAERSKAQSVVLAELPEPITSNDLSQAIEHYRRAIAADPEDASVRAQSLHERLGELEWAHDEWNAALADLEAAINGHSLSPFETYLCRGKAYLYHGVVELHERRPKEAFEDAQAGMGMPREVLAQILPERPIESQGKQTLERLLQVLSNAATHY